MPYHKAQMLYLSYLEKKTLSNRRGIKVALFRVQRPDYHGYTVTHGVKDLIRFLIAFHSMRELLLDWTRFQGQLRYR